MKKRYVAIAILMLRVLVADTAWAQGSSTASISGVVVDAGGGVVPGADVAIKNNGTAEMFTAVTSGQGVFSVPSLITGTYTVTVSLQGFKTVVLNNVIVNAGVPASVRAVLEVGGLSEQVIVQSNAALIQTQSASISTTLDTRQMTNLPLSSRSAFDFVTFLPGVQTASASRDSIVSGLPQSTINITLDGVNIQDNFNKTTDGYFANIGPRIDAMEEVTFSTVASGAESTGMGATQIRFVTKSGTNEYRGGIFHTYRSDALNANTWFNVRDGLAKPQLLQNQPGFNLGGPIKLTRSSGPSKAFFFVSYEEFRSPSSTRRTRQILTQPAQQGIFRYNTAQGVREVNLLQLAAASGQTATVDPITSKLLADIRAATGKSGTLRDLTDPLFQEYVFEVPVQSLNRYPTLRLDYQLSDRHRLTYSMNFQYFGGGPDTTNNREAFFPGFPVVATQGSTRKQASAWLRSILTRNIVNEFRFGYGGSPILFGANDYTREMYSGPLANQGGFYLNMGNALTGLTNAGSAASPSSRDPYSRSIEDTVNWQKGSHTFNIGGLFTQFAVWVNDQQLVPELRFGVVQGDPADAMFTPANFQGASTANITAARALYAILTGRVSEVRGTARLDENNNQYQYLGLGTQRARQREMSFWTQDAWRMRPNLTLNVGARWDVQLPFVALNNSYSIGDYADVFGVSGAGNVFKPGTLTGKPPLFHQLAEGEQPYPIDWNNVAPSAGVAWTPSAGGDGWLHRLTGATGDLAVRAGYARSYSRLGLGTFTGAIGANPGVSLSVFRQLSLGNLGTLPLLMRDPSRLAPPSFVQTPTFPYTEVVTGDITIFSPNLRVPSADTWQAGVTRALGRTMSIEARYVGAKSNDNWRTTNYNELNIFESGFLDEFKLAMTNLQTNIAAGRGATFAYAGPGTGTSPLPIFLAYFNGVPRDRAGDASLYTSANFRSTTFVNPLAKFNPNPYGAVNSMINDAASRARASSAGLPVNLIVANPDLLGGANIVENATRTMYHSMALEFKRRSATGLAVQSSYVVGHADESQFLSLRVDSPMVRNGGTEGDITQAFKVNVVYPLPFGRGQRFGESVSTGLDRLVGGWLVASNARVQSGQLIDLGNVRLVGMTKDELSKAFNVRIDSAGRVWMLPQDIIDESVKAFSASATSPTGWGQLGAPSGRYIAPADSFDCIETIRGEGKCGQHSVIVSGPMFKQVDFSVVKRVPLKSRVSAEFHLDILNVFNNVNFVPTGGTTITNNRADGSNPDGYDVTTLVTGNQARILQLVGRLRW